MYLWAKIQQHFLISAVAEIFFIRRKRSSERLLCKKC